MHYSASKIALYAILGVVQAPKCDFGAFCVHCGYFVTTVTVKPKAELLLFPHVTIFSANVKIC